MTPSKSSGERPRPEIPDPKVAGSAERPDQRPLSPKGHLPRLDRAAYRGQAFVHWTLTFEDRTTGWLSPEFHRTWQHLLLHAGARYDLLCPAYTLMPDHIHLLAVGLSGCTDQWLAIEFLRKHLALAIAPASWQKQPHDHVLRDDERTDDAFAAIAHYIFQNPVRARLVERWQDYAYSGCCITGYPEFDPREPDYWLRFRRVYNYLVNQNAL